MMSERGKSRRTALAQAMHSGSGQSAFDRALRVAYYRRIPREGLITASGAVALNDRSRRGALRWTQHVLLVLLVAVVGVAAFLMLRQPSSPALTVSESGATRTPTRVSRARTIRPYTTATTPRRVGIIPGHWKSDSGATCEDLAEVDITVAVANKTKALLERFGYQVELLPEFSEKLRGYEADVLLSIHADSCKPIAGASGFKVARAANSAIPEIEDRLVDCLWNEYEAAVQLPRHPGSITRDMLYYHAFNEIAPQTPAAIIELGFMGADKAVLVFGQDEIAQGLANAIVCFLE